MAPQRVRTRHGGGAPDRDQHLEPGLGQPRSAARRSGAVGDARLRSCRRPRRLRAGSAGRSAALEPPTGWPPGSTGLSSTACACRTPRLPPGLGSAGIYGTVFFPWPNRSRSASAISSPSNWRPGSSPTTTSGAGRRLCSIEATRQLRRPAFTQSTFFGAPISPAQLRKRAAAYTPSLNEEGRITRFVLASMSNGAALGEIAQQVSAELLVALSQSSGRSQLRR